MWEAGPFPLFSLSAVHAFERIFSSGKISADDTVVKMKNAAVHGWCYCHWLLMGNDPTTRAISWTLQFSHSNSRGTLQHTTRTIITQSHTHLLLFFSYHTHFQARSNTDIFFLHLLLTFSLSKSLPLSPLITLPSLFQFFKSPGWPWAAAASEVAKVQSQYKPTKLVKY